MTHRSHTELYYHFTWSTQDRKELIDITWENHLYAFLEDKCVKAQSKSLAVGGTSDHVHILLRGNANSAPAKIAHDLKGASSFMINRNSFCRRHFDWQDGYGVFTVSPHVVQNISRYIRNQKQHHQRGDIRSEWEYRD